MREILTIIAACLVAALAAALAVPPFIDWTQHRAAIADRLGQGFGGTVSLDGPVRLRLLPAPRLTAGALIAERPGLSVRARETRLELSAPALLRGAFEFTEVALDHADVALDPARIDLSAMKAAPIAVARFEMKDATLRLAGAAPVTLAHVDLDGAADTLAGPFRGEGLWRGDRTIGFAFSTGALDDGKLRGKFAFDHDASGTHVETTGDLTLAGEGPQFTGQAIATGVAGGAPARAGFALIATTASLRAEKIDARIGDEDHALNFSGEAALSADGVFSARMGAANLDLDRFRAGHAIGELAQAASAPAFDLRLAADSVTLAGEALTNVVVQASRAAGAAPRYRLEAGLPGRTRLRYDGAFDWAAPSITGALNAETRDAGRLARYVQPAAPQLARWLSAGAFARLAYEGGVRADARGLALDARRIDFDRSQLSGAIDWRAASAEEPARLTARLAAPVIDIDSLPDLGGLAGLAAQDDLALSLDARALRVARIGEAPAETGRLRMRLNRSGGVTTLDDFSISDLGGASLSGAGRMNAQGGGLDFRLDAERLADLAALARRVAPGAASEAFVARAAALSPAHLNFGLALDSSGAFTQANLSGEAGGARYSAQVAPAGAGRVQARLAVQAAEAAALLRQAGFAILPLKGLGGARLEASGEGAVGGPLKTNARLDLAGVALRFDGETNLALDRASAGGRLTAESADIARLAPLFAFGAPDLSARIPVRGQARLGVGAQGLVLEGIEAEIAGVRARGDLSRAGAGVIGGRLSLDRLSASDLAALVLGAPQPAPAGASWPRLKFAAPRFELPSADIALDAARLDLGDVVAREASMRMTSGPGLLAATDIAAKIGEGRVTGEFALRREGGAAMAKARLTGENLALSSGPFSARASGLVDVAGAGGSMAELVGSLAGAARGTFEAARIAGAAPEALAQVVAEADKADTPLEPRAIAARLAQALDTGAQTLPAFAAEATIASGRISLAPRTTTLDAATARLSGSLDLRTGALDMRETLALPTPAGWASAPEIAIAWSGDHAAPVRSVNADALIAALAERAIAREKERNAALEADIRERIFFNRRLKMDRRNDEERRAAEEERRKAAEEARRAAEEARRQQGAQPPPVAREPARAEPQPKAQAPHRDAPVAPPEKPKMSSPPAAFAPAGKGAAPDPSTAGRY